MTEHDYAQKWRLLLEENIEIHGALKRISRGPHSVVCALQECDEVCPRRIATEALVRVARIPVWGKTQSEQDPPLRCKRHNSIVCRCDVAPTLPACSGCGKPSPNGDYCGTCLYVHREILAHNTVLRLERNAISDERAALRATNASLLAALREIAEVCDSGYPSRAERIARAALSETKG